MTSKLANVAKVKALMAKGMGAKEAIKAAYPDWSDEQVAALAAKMGGGEEKTAAKKIKLTKEEVEALVSPKLRAKADDPRSKEQVISDIHKSRKQMHRRAKGGTALTAGGLAAGVGSFVPKSSKAQAILAGGGLAAMLAGLGSRSSARSKAYKLHRDKMTLMGKIRDERGSKSKKKKASVVVPTVAGHEAPFVHGLRLASGTLHSHYMDKTAANPMLSARLAGLLGGASAQAGKGWKALTGYARKGGDMIETGAKGLSEAVAKKAPGAAAKWAEILKNNPQLASTLGAAKKNWRPLAGGAAAGGLLMSGD